MAPAPSLAVDARHRRGLCQLGRPPFHPQNAHPFAVRLRTTRIAKELSIDQLSVMLGYDPSTVGRWERGEQMPAFHKFIDWCNGLGVSVTLSQ